MPSDAGRTAGRSPHRAEQRLLDGRGRDGLRSVALVLVHSNLWIALGAASLAVTTMALAGLPLDPLPPALVFGATAVVYGVNRLTDLAVDEQNVPGRAAFTRRYGVPAVLLAVGGYVGAVALAHARGVPHAWALWVAPSVGIAYSVRSIQRRLLVKNLLVGVGWAAVPLGVGVYFDALSAPAVWVLAGVSAVLLTVAAMVFDVKDVPGDRAAGVRTVPGVYGVETTRRVAFATTLLVSLVLVGLVATDTIARSMVVLLAFTGYVAAYSTLATRDRSPLFYGFVVDGEHLFLAVVALATT